MNNTPFGRVKKSILSLGLISTAMILVGCGGSSDFKEVVPKPPRSAVVQTIEPNFQSSEVAYIDYSTQTVSGDYYVKDSSDYTITSHGKDVYHIGRAGINTVEKYNSESPDERIFEYTAQDKDEVGSSNPYTLVFANDNTAYLIRYASSKVWIVNPHAADASDFKVGELDLSAYIPADNTQDTPRPSAGVVDDGKLYITMQRLSDSWSSTNDAYVAVYDVATNTEIETNHTGDDDLKGIKLSGLNPVEHNIKAAFGDVYVTTRSPYPYSDLSASMIEKIETSDYSTSTVVGSTDIADNTQATITMSEIVSTTKGYFVATKADFNADKKWVTTSTLYEFNPTTGAVVNANVAETGSEEIAFISVDKSNFLWVSTHNSSASGIDVIDTATNSKTGSRLLTHLNPGTIRFLD